MNKIANIEGVEVFGSRLMARDHFDGLRATRRQHMQNAQWWKQRYRDWGGDFPRQWFLAEARSHRLVSRLLWNHGVN